MKHPFTLLTLAIFLGIFSAFVQAEDRNILPDTFIDKTIGSKVVPLPTSNWDVDYHKIWKFVYNDKVSGNFIKMDFSKANGPVLEINNPSDKFFSLESGQFDIKEPGKYRASIWIRADKNSQKLSKIPDGDFGITAEINTAILMRVIGHDWKKGHYLFDTSHAIQNGWLKYEYEFNVTQDKLYRYFFRIDVLGTGKFYVAEPVLEKIGEIENTQNDIKKPLEETAHFSFDQTVNEDNSKTIASISIKTKLIPGFKGQCLTVEDGGALTYPVNNLLKNESGSIAFWIRSSNDPAPLFAPTDRVGLSIKGLNELGQKADILHASTTAQAGIAIHFYSAYKGRNLGEKTPSKTYFKNEWRHFIFTWDKDEGMNVYLDGHFLNCLTSQSKHLPQVTLEDIHVFTGTGYNPEENAFFDDMRFFNRAVTEDEALALYEEYVPAYPVLLDYAVIAGEQKSFRVRMIQKKDTAPVEFKVFAETCEGENLFEEAITVNDNGDYNINWNPAKEGDYRLVFAYNDKRIRTFEVTAISAKSITESMPESDSGDTKLKLIDEINCVEDYADSRYVDDKQVSVVDSSIGKYRASIRNNYHFQSPNGFAYNFTIHNPGKPHWLEIEYPDDKPRVFYVVVEEKLDNFGWGETKWSNSYSLDTLGVANGINNPVTGKMTKKRLLFWPDSTKILVGCFSYKIYPDCSGPAMKSIRIYENEGMLPKLKVNTPANMPQRFIGNWNEDPYMPNGCWFKRYIDNQGTSFDFWRDKLRRRIEYIRFTGQNQTIFQIFDYNGDNNGLHGPLPHSWNSGILPGWACLAAAMFEREEIPFYLQFNDLSAGIPRIVGLDKCSKSNIEASMKGLQSLEMMTSDGEFPYGGHSWHSNSIFNNLNFLCPEVREAYLKRIRFYRDQFGKYAMFNGIMQWQIPPFKDEKTGYGDYTISLFEKETGVRIPVKNIEVERFGKRYDYLKTNIELWNKWIDWRCAKVKEFLLVLTDELNASKKNGRKIILPMHTNYINQNFCTRVENYPENVDVFEAFREIGIDLSLLSSEPSLIIEPTSAPNCGLKFSEELTPPNYDSFIYSDDFANALKANHFPSLLLSRHANMEIYGSMKSEIKNWWWPRGGWSKDGFHCFSSAMPDNQYLPQTLAWNMAYGDLWHIDHGWWGNPENGAYDKFQEFYQAYRSIPAVHFREVPGVNDPIMVRQYTASGETTPMNSQNVCDTSNWFYLVNTQYYKTTVKITFNTNGELTDAVHNRPEKVDGNILVKELAPYQLIAFCSDKPLIINNVEQMVPEEIATELAQNVAALKIGDKLQPSEQTKLLVGIAEKMLAENRYSALYYLLRGHPSRQILKSAEKPVVFEANLNPDTNLLTINVVNRMPESVSCEVALKVFSKGVSCYDQPQKCAIPAKGRHPLSFPLSGSRLREFNCRNGIEFDIDSRVNNGGTNRVKLFVYPIVSTKTTAEIKIDGSLSEWDKSKWNKLGPCDFYLALPEYEGVKFGLEKLVDAEFASIWNQNGLYLAIRVKEKDFIPAPEGQSAWQYDFVEIMFDQNNDAMPNQKEMDKNDCAIYLTNSQNASFPQVSLEPAEGQDRNWASQCKVNRQRDEEATVYEIFIPATLLNQVSFTPESNIGFALKLHNREHKNSKLDLWDIAVSCPEYPCEHPGVWNKLLFSESVD